MADYHCSVKTISRANGRSGTAAAAYRAGEKVVDHNTGEVHDYSKKKGVLHTEIVTPADAPRWTREELWNAAEAAEKRGNATVAREIVIALPCELDAEQRQELAVSFARDLSRAYTVAVDVAVHAPSERGDQRNHHAHLLLTTREIGPAGLGAKTRVLDSLQTGPGEIRALRAHWADVANAALERAGRSERIDPRSHADRGIDDEPSKHNGPAVTAAGRRGDHNPAWRHERRELTMPTADKQQSEQPAAERAAPGRGGYDNSPGR